MSLCCAKWEFVIITFLSTKKLQGVNGKQREYPEIANSDLLNDQSHWNPNQSLIKQ